MGDKRVLITGAVLIAAGIGVPATALLAPSRTLSDPPPPAPPGIEITDSTDSPLFGEDDGPTPAPVPTLPAGPRDSGTNPRAQNPAPGRTVQPGNVVPIPGPVGTSETLPPPAPADPGSDAPDPIGHTPLPSPTDALEPPLPGPGQPGGPPAGGTNGGETRDPDDDIP